MGHAVDAAEGGTVTAVAMLIELLLCNNVAAALMAKAK
jgi:hypothetical protein